VNGSPVFASPALEVRNLTKQFPGVLALDGMAFVLRRGEIHALVGQNGAGKSTMINVLSGMLTPDAGEICLAGQPASIDSTRKAIELGIATVYQELSLLPNLTVAQNIALGHEPRRFGLLDVAAMRTAARTALARIGVEVADDIPVGRLSLAERQLVEIAKALAHDPTVLVLDEPTAALGGREVERLFAILRRLSGAGMSIVYVSHRFREILDLCDRATVLRNGRVVTTAELAGWKEADLTEAMVGGRSEVFARARRAAGCRPPMIAAEGLRYSDQVKDVSFSVAEGEILALTGLLGSGQNEIARLLGGDLQPDAGSIVIGGRKVVLRHPSDGRAAGICLVSDERKREGILPNLTLRENIALPSLGQRRAGGLFVDRAAERAAVAESVRQFGVVAGSLETPMRSLSGGNQQKALIARWHLAAAMAFVLIEPTHGVDVAARGEIYRRLDALAAAGKALVVVSSEIADVLAIADRILIIREGLIAAATTPSETDEEDLNLMIQGAG
jgi:ABC-type sugar transport system ATPase subunit